MKILRIISVFLTVVLIACGQTPVVITPPVPPPAAQVPKQLVETFVIDSSTPAGQPTVTLTLTKTPAAGTILHLVFHSSQFGWDDTMDVVPIGPNTKQILFTIPTYRPFTPADQLSVSYSTLE